MDQQPGAELTLPPGAEGAPEARTEVHIRYARGEGVIVDGDLAPFHDALIRVATETEVQAWQQRHVQPHAMLRLGDLALAAGVPCLADAPTTSARPSRWTRSSPSPPSALSASPPRGRKFGLYLLVSTQRPQKIPQNVLSQADNLVLLRLNSLADAAFAQAVFSFVPPGLIERSATFRQGEGLIAGKISPEPALLRFGARISEEGGADVPPTWAYPR
jgi:hypothetical protein